VSGTKVFEIILPLHHGIVEVKILAHVLVELSPDVVDE
jgi:hypothetical protein